MGDQFLIGWKKTNMNRMILRATSHKFCGVFPPSVLSRAFHSEAGRVCRGEGVQGGASKAKAINARPEPPGPEDCCQVGS